MLLPLGEDSSCYVGEWSLPLIFSFIVLFQNLMKSCSCDMDISMPVHVLRIHASCIRMTTQLSGRFQGALSIAHRLHTSITQIRTGDSHFPIFIQSRTPTKSIQAKQPAN